MNNLTAKIIKSGLISWGALFIAWGIISLFYTESFFPSPVETYKGFKEILLNGKLWEDISISVQRVLF